MFETMDLGRKRDRAEESKENDGENKWSDVKKTYVLIRDISDDDIIKLSLSTDYFLDPPNFSRFLDIFVDFEESNVEKLSRLMKHEYLEGQLEETEKNAKQLGKMIEGDPRVGKFLDNDFLKLLVEFLGNEQNPRLQFHAATIIRHFIAYSTNKQVAIQLLRAMALGIPDYPEINFILEKALDPVISFISSLLADDSPKLKILHIGTVTLATVCQVYPMLPEEKLETVLLALRNLILYQGEEYFTEVFLPSVCSALAYLCDGRGAMVVKDHFFGEIIDRLIVLIDSDSIINCNAGLIALGRIVRWASDYHIQVIIEKGVLWSVEWMIRQDQRHCVMYACWIISNITARKGNFIEDVIRCECIGSLVDVVKNFKFLEAKREAAWAIIYAIHGASDDQIELFRLSCVKALWNVPTVFSDHLDMVFACLEVLAKLEVVTVTFNGNLINNVQFQKYLVTLQGRQFQLADDIVGLPKSKKLRTTDNLGKYDGDMEFLLTCTSEEDSDLQ